MSAFVRAHVQSIGMRIALCVFFLQYSARTSLNDINSKNVSHFSSFSFTDADPDGVVHCVTSAWCTRAAATATATEVHGSASVIRTGVESSAIKVSVCGAI